MGGPGSRTGTIWIVEDDPDIGGFVSAMLEEAGYAVRVVPSGEEAIELARRDQPLLVLLDVRLPGVSGYEVCRFLRDRFRGNVPIVFMSAARKEGFDRAAGLMLGADDYLVKPFSNEELVARVRALVRRTVPSPRSFAVNLTAREQEVLRLLAGGLGQKEISGYLVISPKTVGTHIEHILMKLGVPSRAQAVALAYRDNLLGPTPVTALTRTDPAGRSTIGSSAIRPPLRAAGETRPIR